MSALSPSATSASVSPVAGPEERALLGYLKRGAVPEGLRLSVGTPVRVVD